MTKLARSPHCNSSQLKNYLERRAAEGRTPDNDPHVAAMAQYYTRISVDKMETEKQDAWSKDNLEYDLRSTAWILEKVRTWDTYAQNLYAALCNNVFQRLDTWPILTDQHWRCSWRYAGGIIADMRESGDYIDWYCSGIREIGETQEPDAHGRVSEPESVVTDEVRADLKDLGWAVIDSSSKDNQ